MRQRIETTSSMSWQVTLARTLSFSEYMLYGIFVREVAGYRSVDHAPSAVPLVKPSWGLALGNDTALSAFFSDLDPRTVALMIYSKDGIAPDRYRPHLEHYWRAL